MSHRAKTISFLKDESYVDWHNDSIWAVREKRDNKVHSIPEWEALRNVAEGIKTHAISNLSHYLIEFEKHAIENGVNVHWALNAAEHKEPITSDMFFSTGGKFAVDYFHVEGFNVLYLDGSVKWKSGIPKIVSGPSEQDSVYWDYPYFGETQ